MNFVKAKRMLTKSEKNRPSRKDDFVYSSFNSVRVFSVPADIYAGQFL